jgi:hypothetical protein
MRGREVFGIVYGGNFVAKRVAFCVKEKSRVII